MLPKLSGAGNSCQYFNWSRGTGKVMLLALNAKRSTFGQQRVVARDSIGQLCLDEFAIAADRRGQR